MTDKSPSQPLFGASAGWQARDWTASDDRVRGGKSQSYLDISNSSAIFRGVLDIKTLGGAGFASQRTTGEDRSWNLAGYDGIQLEIDTSTSDNKVYAFILKDEILPKNPDDGREQSTTSWEYEFKSTQNQTDAEAEKVETLLIPWNSFKPTYRGRDKPDAEKLKLNSIKRMSIMMRSFFGTQEGDFHLTLNAISAFKVQTRRRSSRPPILRIQPV